jgi:diadenosine tetraphosphate (Ap4A) HIT family hydrolase
LFWRGSEVNRGQKCANQQHQQIDFHVIPRSTTQLNAASLQPYDDRAAKDVPLCLMAVVG